MNLNKTAKDAPIANPGEASFYDEQYRRIHRSGEAGLFRMWAGAGDVTYVYVWADGLESAFEELVEWLDDNAPGRLVKLDAADYKAAAKSLGAKWRSSWPDWDDRDFQKVAEAAEADLTAIGHTTLEHGTHIASWEWGGESVHPGGPEYETVEHRSKEEAEDDDDDDDED